MVLTSEVPSTDFLTTHPAGRISHSLTQSSQTALEAPTFKYEAGKQTWGYEKIEAKKQPGKPVMQIESVQEVEKYIKNNSN